MAEKVQSLVEEWGMLEGSPAHQWYTEGVEEGIEKGIEKGREKQIDYSIRNMIQKGYPFPEIAEIQGVSLVRIEEIAKEMGKA